MVNKDLNRMNLEIGRQHKNNTIGQYSGGGSYSFEGYMQDFRIYKGVAKYTEEFLCGAVDSSITEHSPSGISVPRKLDPSTGGSTGFNMEGASVFLGF